MDIEAEVFQVEIPEDGKRYSRVKGALRGVGSRAVRGCRPDTVSQRERNPRAGWEAASPPSPRPGNASLELTQG